MKNLITFILLHLIIISNSSLMAQDSVNETVNELSEVVILASKFPVKVENTGRSIVYFNQATLEKLPFQSVSTLLNQITGIEINGTQNAAGKNLGYYIRGGRSHQLLVLIDGIPVTDPSGINFSYDLNLLSIHQIESIEIMKGASSTLYGTGAATAVINIKLKEATTGKVGGAVLFTTGSNNSSKKENYKPTNFSQTIDLKASTDKTTYYLSFTNTLKKGMSEGLVEQPEPLEDDVFQQLNVLTKIKHSFSDKLSVLTMASYRKINHDYDFAFTDSEINHYENTEKMLSFLPEYTYQQGKFSGTLAYKILKRNDVNEYGLSNFKAESVTANLFNTHHFNANWSIVSGLDYQYQTANFDTTYEVLTKDIAHFYMLDPYVNAVYQGTNGFNLNFGGRINLHENYGSNWVYNLNPSYLIKTKLIDINLMASLSSAFITPSLYQLYSSYGNIDLTPEASKTYEIGYTLKNTTKSLNFSQLYFLREETNTIGFFTDMNTWISYYYNQPGKQFFRGLEHDLTYKLSNQITLNLNNTYTHLAPEKSYLIPKIKWNSSVNFNDEQLGNVTLSYHYKGKRTAQNFQNFPATVEVLKSVNLVDLGYGKSILNDKMTLYVDITNLFNEKYVENLGYVTKATNINLGIKYIF